MQRTSIGHILAQLLAAALGVQIAAGAPAADTYSGNVLTLDSLAIGDTRYSSMVISPITVGDVLAYTVGGAPNGSADVYDPGTALLTIPSITIGTVTFTNVVVQVPAAASVSIGSATGADTYDGAALTISQVQDGGVAYANVVVSETPGNVVRVAGGMPTALPDTYDPVTNELSIPAVQFGNRVYTNVVVTAGQLQRVGGVSFRNQGSVLHAFSDSATGIYPTPAVVQGSDGNFYGTTSQGGTNGDGVVYAFSPDGTQTLLYAFAGGTGDGSNPNGALVQGSDGNFYGTTQQGGAYDQGVIFDIAPSGAESVLHSFAGGGADGSDPAGGLIQDSDGNFYGTTLTGGLHNQGVIFRSSPSGAVTVLHSFGSGTADGNTPNGSLVQGRDGTFYGTTQGGGTYGKGTFFNVTSAGIETVLYSFGHGATDGVYPFAAIQGSDGNFYVAAAGGNNGSGALIRITPAGVESTLYSFAGSTWGGSPDGALVEASDGNFYGTYTYNGSPDMGSPGESAIFKVTPSGIGTVLYSFGPTGGYTDADGALIQGRDGSLVGTGMSGGPATLGTVFEISLAGT